MSPQPQSVKKVASGIIPSIVGLCVCLWVNRHSPHMGFAEMLTKFGSYFISESFYSLIVLIAPILGLGGTGNWRIEGNSFCLPSGTSIMCI